MITTGTMSIPSTLRVLTPSFTGRQKMYLDSCFPSYAEVVADAPKEEEAFCCFCQDDLLALEPVSSLRSSSGLCSSSMFKLSVDWSKGETSVAAVALVELIYESTLNN